MKIFFCPVPHHPSQCLTVRPIQQLKQQGILTTNCLQDQQLSLCAVWTPASCCCWPTTVFPLTITACCCPCSIITTGASLLRDSVFIVLYFCCFFFSLSLSLFENRDFVVITSIPVLSLGLGSAFHIALMNTTVAINMSMWSMKTSTATETNIYLETEEWHDEMKSLLKMTFLTSKSAWRLFWRVVFDFCLKVFFAERHQCFFFHLKIRKDQNLKTNLTTKMSITLKGTFLRHKSTQTKALKHRHTWGIGVKMMQNVAQHENMKGREQNNANGHW